MPSMTPDAATPMVKATDVHKHFGALHVLRGVSLTVARGEVVAVLGPSGSGKSTLLRCLNHLETIERGCIEIAGKTLAHPDATGLARYPSESEARRICQHTGMVFQHFNLFPHLTVLQNLIEAPMTVRKRARAEVVPLAEALLAQVGLADKRDAWPARLSGGQKQRVAIARALAMQPDILLFDEPTSALDPELVTEVLKVMRTLAREGRTMVVVTHEMGFARDVANHLIFLHQGRIEEQGVPAQVLANPRSERLGQFLAGSLK